MSEQLLVELKMKLNEKLRAGNHIQQEVMHGHKVDEVVKITDVHTSLYDKINDSLK